MALATAVPMLGYGTASAASRLGIASVSNPRPQFVSGGQVLVRVTPAGSRPATLSANGHDVSLHREADGSLLGLATGLREGANTLEARQSGQRATLRVTNHPITGPVLSGRQQLPFRPRAGTR
jgi:hypothetical protein